MMVKRAAYDKAKGFDERFQLCNCDVDFCLKVAKEGYLIAYNGGVEAYRKGSGSDGRSALTKKQQLRAEREKAFLHYRWPHLFVDGDPYMSSCLDPGMRHTSCLVLSNSYSSGLLPVIRFMYKPHAV